MEQTSPYFYTLTSLYLALVCASFFQIARIVYFRHNIFHYQFGLLVAIFIWGIVSSTFWLRPEGRDDLTALALQGLALDIQFATMTFLVLFYQQLIHKANHVWKEQAFYSIFIFLFLNMGFLLLYVVFLDSDVAQRFNASFASALYLCLSILLAYFGIKLFWLISVDKIAMPFLKSQHHVIFATGILVFIYMSRAIRDFLFACRKISDTTDPLGLFFMYFFWDIIPGTIVLVLFWRIPSNQTPAPVEPQVDSGGYSDAGPVQQFRTLSRYDSEEEVERVENEDPAFLTDAPVIITPKSKLPAFPKLTYNPYDTRSPLNQPNLVQNGGSSDSD